MKKKLVETAVLGMTAAALVLTGCSTGNGKIRFGAAGLGGTYRVVADTFSDLVMTKNDEYKMEVKTTAGSAANIRLLSDGYIQMAIAQADLVNDAYYGTGLYEGQDKAQGYSAIGSIYVEKCQIVVRPDSQIQNVEDLQGKTVSVGEEESGTEQNAEQILAAYGLSDRLVDEVNLDYTNAAEELQSGKIDAFFCTAGTQTTVISELAKQCEIRLVSLDETGIEKLTKSYDFYTECEIPSGTYTGQDETVRTVGVNAILLASDKLPEKTVKELTQILFENKQELQYTLPVDILPDEKTAVQGVTIPFHEGAAAYYKSCGIEVSAETATDGANE